MEHFSKPKSPETPADILNQIFEDKNIDSKRRLSLTNAITYALIHPGTYLSDLTLSSSERVVVDEAVRELQKQVGQEGQQETLPPLPEMNLLGIREDIETAMIQAINQEGSSLDPSEKFRIVSNVCRKIEILIEQTDDFSYDQLLPILKRVDQPTPEEQGVMFAVYDVLDKNELFLREHLTKENAVDLFKSIVAQ